MVSYNIISYRIIPYHIITYHIKSIVQSMLSRRTLQLQSQGRLEYLCLWKVMESFTCLLVCQSFNVYLQFYVYL